ncbi:TPA: hypothetical protein U1B14_000628 [Streptococcus suis]|uniref:hypothetical protein n=1 Tax=Streptococcus TaxID=1301 RepID=UPI000CF3BFB3|nr:MULTISPECIES: hypothetical protein [Streptococcus]MBY0719176.1 hypothetical protein [Streptococcus sp. 2018110]MCO8188627.1 hypothetical protein [Streptococcus suis]MCO8204612.1 hypothetical protein [Streptococcus suis]MCO8206811.1 hypothetical protein [Streptococcus suis]MCO8211166.1 hypothetical protein [Streptococcus suis]
MKEIYVDRKITPEELLNSVHKKIILLQSDDESGLSYFLKHTTKFFNSQKLTSFYISGDEKIAKQIFRQIFNAITIEEVEKKISKYSKKDVILAVLKTMVYPLDNIPFIPNIGSSIVNIIDCIDSTLNVDAIHYEDYRLELALIEYLNKINPRIALIIEGLDERNIDFLKVLIQHKVDLIIAVPNRDKDKIIRFLSKSEISNPYKWEKKFLRPDNYETLRFFESYQIQLDNQSLSKISASNFSIHAIMSCINKYDFDRKLTVFEQIIIGALTQLNCPLPLEFLEKVYRTYHQKTLTLSTENADMSETFDKLSQDGFIEFLDSGKVILANTGHSFVQSQVEERLLVNAIVDVITNTEELSVELCKYGIRHSDKQLSKKKYFLFELLKIQKDKIDTDYLLQLVSCELDNLTEFLTLGRLLYNRFYFKEASQLLQKYAQYRDERSYQLLKALVNERLRTKDHLELLHHLLDTSVDDDEKCLLLSNLFVAYINSNNFAGYREILNKSGKFYHKNFLSSKHYPYLLRNVAFYLPFEEGMVAYQSSLTFFRGIDIINYNRTLSNYICFLMEFHTIEQAREELQNLESEIQQILVLKDNRYEYLYNNFSLYLMNFTDQNPIPYFNMISEDETGSETPFIYSRINLVLYLAKVSPLEANILFSQVKSLVDKSSVHQTKRFFEINQLFYLYMNDVDISEYLGTLDTSPFRNDDHYVEELAFHYLQKIEEGQKYTDSDWKTLFCPGYLFYRYYDVKLLFPDKLYY